MENQWSYREYQIRDGLKPGSPHFQYFYVVSRAAEKVCNYCVWVVDEALPRFDKSKNFDAIAVSQRETWNGWVKGKIDAGDFDNKVLKCDMNGETEINLSEMTSYLSMK
jgi:hypothetical protein